jgi:site-specific DNA-methyltransferase (adenine-specific)
MSEPSSITVAAGAPASGYAVGSVRLFQCDCLEVYPYLQGVDAVITDPPYGAKEKTDRASRRSSQPTKGSGKSRLLKWSPIIGDDQPFDPSLWLMWDRCVMWGANYKLPPSRRWLVWDKREGTTPDDNADVELAWCSVDGVARMHAQLWRGLCMRGEENATQRLHPAQKPVALMAWCMEQAKVPVGATVIDPYMGSGTTGIACLRTGRKFIGIEKDPEHFATAVERLRREQQQGRLL